MNEDWLYLTFDGKNNVKIYLESRILSFRRLIDERFYPELLEEYDKHFGIETYTQGKITKEDLNNGK